MKHETFGPTWPLLFVPELSNIITSQARGLDLLNHLQHRLAVRLPGDLKKCRSRKDPSLPAPISEIRRDMVQGQSLGDRASGFAEFLCHLLVRVEEFLAELDQAVGLLEWTQIAPLKILNQTDLEDSPVVDIDLDTRDLRKTGLERCSISSLSGDDLKFLAGRPDEDRLQNALLLDGRDEIGHIAERTPGLVRVRNEEIERDHAPDPWRRSSAQVVDKMEVMPHSSLCGQTTLLRHVR